MRVLSITLCALVGGLLLAGCSISGSPTPQTVAPFQGHLAPPAARQGIYVSQTHGSIYNIAGFRENGKGPICHVSAGNNEGEIATDRAGNLIVPFGSSSVSVYNGPGMCGSLRGTITDAYVGSAAAIDAVNGPIIVDADDTNEVAVCDLSENACARLKSPKMVGAASVAMDGHGNCYADAVDSSGTTGLWIYRNCTRRGKELTSADGFSEPYLGDIAIDDQGNLAAVALYGSMFKPPSTLTVYSGCITGICKVVGGPFALQGESPSAHLSLKNDRLVATDITYNKVDIYSYAHGTALEYLYSFDGCGARPYFCESATYSTSSPK